jgi:hypothetical protein
MWAEVRVCDDNRSVGDTHLEVSTVVAMRRGMGYGRGQLLGMDPCATGGRMTHLRRSITDPPTGRPDPPDRGHQRRRRRTRHDVRSPGGARAPRK